MCVVLVVSLLLNADADKFCAVDGFGDGAWVAEDADHAFEDGFAAEEFDFDAEEVDGDVGFDEVWEADEVFFCGDDHADVAFFAAVDEVAHVACGEAVVVCEAFDDVDFGAEFAESVFEAFWCGDAADGADVCVVEGFKWEFFACVDVFEVGGAVSAFDDFCDAVVFADFCDDVGVVAAVAFGEEDVAGAFEVLWGFAEGAAWEHVAVAPGGGAVDEDHVEAVFEAEVLEAVVEDEDVCAEFFECVDACFDAVFVDDDGDAWEVGGEHEGFVACDVAVEEDAFAVADDAWWVLWEWFAADACDEFGPDADAFLAFAFVASGEDGDAASVFLEGACEEFADGGFAGAADGEVADADDWDAEVVVVDVAFFVEFEAEADGAFIDPGEGVEDDACDAFFDAGFVVEDDGDGPLF